MYFIMLQNDWESGSDSDRDAEDTDDVSEEDSGGDE